MTATLAINGADTSGATRYDVTVEAGRDDVESQPDGSVLAAVIEGWQPAGQIGDPVTLADVDGVLFTGTITDLAADLDSSDAKTWTTSLTATGPLADLGRIASGLTDYPQETDSQRIDRVLAAAGVGYLLDPNILGFDILARAAEQEMAADLARSAADDGMGVLWEQPADPATPIRYTPNRLRKFTPYYPAWQELDPAQAWSMLPAALTWATWDADTAGGGPVGLPPSLDIPANALLAQASFKQQIGDLIATITVEYGVDPGTTGRPVVTAGTGQPARSYSTQLADAGEAATYADTMLRRYQEPAWRLSGLAMPLHDAPPAERAQVRAALTVGTRLTVGFPLGSPVGTMWQGFMEGWRHRITGIVEDDGTLVEEHWLDLRASERSMTEAADRWQDIPPAVPWAGLDPGMAWVYSVDWG